MAQNILPTPQAEFAALGFCGEPLNQMIQRSFEEQNQGLANAHGYKMISPYIDPRGATNGLTGKQFFVVHDTPNARGFALTACLPATEELKKHMRPGVVLEGPAVLMGHNATLANPAVSTPEEG